MNTIVIFFSRADENYFGGAMKYVEVGNTEIAVGHITELTADEMAEIRALDCGKRFFNMTLAEQEANLGAWHPAD